MAIPEAFILRNLGTKFEIVPYFTRTPESVLRYRITVRTFAPPSNQSFTATPTQLQALLSWVDTALAVNPSYVETYQHGRQADQARES